MLIGVADLRRALGRYPLTALLSEGRLDSVLAAGRGRSGTPASSCAPALPRRCWSPAHARYSPATPPHACSAAPRPTRPDPRAGRLPPKGPARRLEWRSTRALRRTGRRDVRWTPYPLARVRAHRTAVPGVAARRAWRVPTRRSRSRPRAACASSGPRCCTGSALVEDPRGRRQSQILLDLATGLAESPAESWLLLGLFDADFSVPAQQVPVLDHRRASALPARLRLGGAAGRGRVRRLCGARRPEGPGRRARRGPTASRLGRHPRGRG